MIVMKKTHLIAIIFFVVITQVLGSEIFKRADGSQCTSKGGQCMNPNSCTGTVQSGLCPGGDDNKCCIPNSQPSSGNNNDGSQCTSKGGQCMNPNSCTGTVQSGLCPGGDDNKCCIPKPNPKPSSTQNKPNNTNNGSQCTSKGGQCMNPNSCTGTVQPGLCPGGDDNKCCIPKPNPNPNPNPNPKPSSTQNKPNNTNNGSQCTSQGGQCINRNNCTGTIKHNLCPGGNDVKCCIPKPNPKPNPNPNPNPNPKPSNTQNKPSNTKNGSKCTSQGGQCINRNNCTGTIKHNLCPGGNDVKCCIPKPNPKPSGTQNKPSNTNNGSKCTSQGGQCINRNNCTGTIKHNLCPGGNDVKCCIPKKITNPSVEGVGEPCFDKGISGICINTDNTKCTVTLVNGKCKGPSNVRCCLKNKQITTNKKDIKCINQGGQCMNPINCSGIVKYGLCSGDSSNMCCIPKRTTTVKKSPKQTTANKKDSKCTSQGGQCMNPNNCTGTVKYGLCSGDSSNMCCIPKRTTTVKTVQKKTTTIKKSQNKQNVSNSSECKAENGTCKDVSVNPCNTVVLGGFCPDGGNNVKCCVPNADHHNNINVWNVDLHVKGSTKTTISDLKEALSHYRGKSGNTVPASPILIHEMKSHDSFNKMIRELKEKIKGKINDTAIKNGTIIKSDDGSRRGKIKCNTLGSYSVDLSYSFTPKKGDNTFYIHFKGSNPWDFEKNGKFMYDLINEDIPSAIAGDGKAYDITYEFSYLVTINY